MSAPEYVTEISVTSCAARNGWRLCSGMKQPEPLPDPETEPEAGQ